MQKQKILVVIFLLLCGKIFAQVENRRAGWFTSTSSIRIKNKWGAQIDLISRTTDEWKNLQIFIVRAGLSYRFSDKLTAIVGFNNNHSRVTVNTTTGYVNEFQVWQQLFIRHRLGPLFTVHRPLLEERFIPVTAVRNNKIEVDDKKFGLRARYLLRNQLPFKARKTFTKGLYAVTQQEIMLNIGDNDFANNRIFDQFRWFTGMGYRFSHKMDLETGYLYRSQATRSSLTFHDHVWQLTMFLRL